jgi:hypothetical protein
VFIIRVGGDFMHGRMCLPGTFALLLPVAMVPLRRVTAPAFATVAMWAAYIGISRADGHNHCTYAFVNDERVGYTLFTHNPNPTTSAAYVEAERAAADFIADSLKHDRRILTSEGGILMELDPAVAANVVFAAGRLGTGGAVTPLDGIAADTLGLANPIGARIPVTNPGWVGHEKPLPFVWLMAAFADLGHYAEHPMDDVSPGAVRAARHAMHCGDLAELMASVQEPMTWSRFWRNLTGASARTSLVVPVDPFEAELKFCGDTAVLASSNLEGWGWSKANLIDGITESIEGHSMGFTTEESHHENHTEWVELHFPMRAVTGVAIYPRTGGDGFPVDFTLQVWDGERWVDRAVRTDQPRPTGPVELSWQPADVTTKIRLNATKLGMVRDMYILQLAELQVR